MICIFQGGVVYLPSCIGDVCWTSAVLTALGTTLSVILDIDIKLSIILSAAIAVSYTLIGGMYSVAFTDVIQIVFIFFGLWSAIPFIWSNDEVQLSNLSLKDWTGEIKGVKSWMEYIDTFLLITCGGIPWQPYYQRALAVKSTKHGLDKVYKQRTTMKMKTSRKTFPIFHGKHIPTGDTASEVEMFHASRNLSRGFLIIIIFYAALFFYGICFAK